MKYLVCFLIFNISVFLANSSVFSYDCQNTSLKERYQGYDWIFVGRITTVTDTAFKVKVLEVFKGDFPAELTGKIYKNGYNKRISKGIWLIYAFSLSPKSFYIDVCSASRSFKKPFSIQSKNLQLIPNDFNNTTKDQSITQFLLNNSNLSELFFEITNLRLLRSDEKNRELMSEVSYLKNNHLLIKQHLFIVIVLLIVIILVIVVSFYFLWHKMT